MDMDEAIERVIVFEGEIKGVKEDILRHDGYLERIEGKVDKLLWWVMGIMGSVILSIILG
jgi:hypothetical protein